MQLGILLSFVAGVINAGGFVMVGYYTSHMTGVVSSLAADIALNNKVLAVSVFMFLVSFVSGAFTSTIVVNWARNKKLHGEFAISLMIEALLLLVLGVFAGIFVHSGVFYTDAIVMLLCFIMGLQNAIITKISNAEIRTTHVTGIATDIGIEIGRIICLRKGDERIPLQYHRLIIHLSLLASFLIGGIIGVLGFKYLGSVAAIILSAIIGLVASVPIFDDFKRKAI